jgi:hypothetical protein
MGEETEAGEEGATGVSGMALVIRFVLPKHCWKDTEEGDKKRD